MPWYGQGDVAVYLFAETDPNADSVAMGAKEVSKLYPGARLFVLDVSNSQLSEPLPHFGHPKVLLDLLKLRNVTVSCGGPAVIVLP